MELKKGRMRFSKSIIQQAIAEVESGVSRKEVCKKYGMAYVTLCEWMNRFASQDYELNQKRPRLTQLQKRSIVRAVLDGRLTIREANIKHRIQGRDTIKRWIREFKEAPLKEQSSIKNNSPLEEQLAAANLKVLALETLIDVAEEDLKIKIRKKSGAKQLPK